MGQDEDQGGVFCDSKGRRYGGEDQGGKNQNYEEGSGGVMTEMKVIMVLLCLTVEAEINHFVNTLKINFFAAVILSCCNQSLLQVFFRDIIFS